MARVQTFDHCGFIVEDIPRAERVLKEKKPLWLYCSPTTR